MSTGNAKQIARTDYDGELAAAVYHMTGDPEHEVQGRLVLTSGETVDVFLPESVMDEIEKGDIVSVTVEISKSEARGAG